MSPAYLRGFLDLRRALGREVPVALALASAAGIAASGLLETAGGASSSGAAGNLTRSSVMGIWIPLWCFAWSALGEARAGDLLRAAGPRHGLDRRHYALGRWSLQAAASVLSALALVALCLLVERAAPGHGGAGVARLTLAAVLGAASYSACFSAAQVRFGAWGRSALLALDWLLGSTTGALALPWPRSHLRALLGGEPVLSLGAVQSTLCLTFLMAAACLWSASRVPR